MNAIDEYKMFNKGKDVEHIIIYRDGVGDGMRDLVRSEELKML